MDDEFHDLQRLLRLKRHEAPPPDFFEDFMREFHRRQREELLKRPLWRLALDRLEAAIPSFSLTRYAYAGGCTAALLAAGLVSGRILTAPTHLSAGPQRGQKVVMGEPKTSPRINLNSSHPTLRLSPDLDFDQPRRVAAMPAAANSHPRYVLDTQPVRYEERTDF